MDNIDVNHLLEKYKSKIMYIGPQNGKLNQIKHIINNTGPNPEKLFILEGIWAHGKAITTNIKIRSFVFCPECIYSNEAVEMAETFINKTDDVYVVSKKVFMKISERDEPDGLLSIGIFPVCSVDSLKIKDDAVIIVLDGLEIPGNIGTILRTCDGAGVDAVFICNKRARLTHPKLIKGSMGAAFVKPIVEFAGVDECKKWLAERGFKIYLADTRAEKYYNGFSYEGNTALIMGSERYGISREWYDSNINMLSIPMLGVCDSLNVGIAASIIIYEICMKKKGM